MRVWAKVITDHRIQRDVVQEFASARPSDIDGWGEALAVLCKPLDLAVPVLLNKHIRELAQFSRTVFKPEDFLESVDFDRFEVEIFPEKKKDSRREYLFG